MQTMLFLGNARKLTSQLSRVAPLTWEALQMLRRRGGQLEYPAVQGISAAWHRQLQTLRSTAAADSQCLAFPAHTRMAEAWMWKSQGCLNGALCMRCHLCPAGEIKRRKKDRSGRPTNEFLRAQRALATLCRSS